MSISKGKLLLVMITISLLQIHISVCTNLLLEMR